MHILIGLVFFSEEQRGRDGQLLIALGIALAKLLGTRHHVNLILINITDKSCNLSKSIKRNTSSSFDCFAYVIECTLVITDHFYEHLQVYSM